MTAGKVLIVRAAGPEAFGMTPGERLERLSTRQGLAVTRDADEADVIVRGDHVYGASVFNELWRSAPGQSAQGLDAPNPPYDGFHQTGLGAAKAVDRLLGVAHPDGEICYLR